MNWPVGWLERGYGDAVQAPCAGWSSKPMLCGARGCWATCECRSSAISMSSSSGRQPGGQLDYWEWQLQAACRSHPVEMFFSPWGERGGARARREAAAKAVCGSCPVLLACRAHALRTGESYGIWGGLSEQERQRLLDQERACGHA